MQLWSAFHPDPNAHRPTRPMADVWRYTGALLERMANGEFRLPPSIAQARRNQARMERRNASRTKRTEARRLAYVTAQLARGEYPGLG